VKDKLSLVHLSGPRQGQVDVLTRLPASIGSAPDADVVVPGVAERRALLLRRNSDLILQDGSDEGFLLVAAGRTVHEAALRDGDLVRLGEHGPTLRFQRETHSRLPLLGAALSHPRARAASERAGVAAFLRALFRETGARTSRAFRVALVALAVTGTLAFVWSQRQSSRLRRELDALATSLRAAEQERLSFQQRIEQERRKAASDKSALEARIEEYREREEQLRGRLREAASGEVQAVREELQLTRERLQMIESERAAGENIIRSYGAGVCLIQGSYGFYDSSNRPLRYDVDDNGKPKRDSEGSLELDVEKKGPVHTVDFLGTGFLVDRRGYVLTNRHLAEPWWNDGGADALQKAGYKPRFVLFRAFFPGESEPYELDFVGSSEKLDLAMVAIERKGRRLPPILPLDHQGRGAVAGQPVVVVGYPTGLEAIMAKAESGTVRQILEAHGTNQQRMTEALAEKGLIRPSTTQGHIGDVTPTDIVFDAPTTQGGSGGPVFNKNGRVIAVEYAVLPKFGGNSFGIPIRYALDLLRRKPRASD
jgi:S1-C subfamily serine protease